MRNNIFPPSFNTSSSAQKAKFWKCNLETTLNVHLELNSTSFPSVQKSGFEHKRAHTHTHTFLQEEKVTYCLASSSASSSSSSKCATCPLRK